MSFRWCGRCTPASTNASSWSAVRRWARPTGCSTSWAQGCPLPSSWQSRVRHAAAQASQARRPRHRNCLAHPIGIRRRLSRGKSVPFHRRDTAAGRTMRRPGRNAPATKPVNFQRVQQVLARGERDASTARVSSTGVIHENELMNNTGYISEWKPVGVVRDQRKSRSLSVSITPSIAANG